MEIRLGINLKKKKKNLFFFCQKSSNDAKTSWNYRAVSSTPGRRGVSENTSSSVCNRRWNESLSLSLSLQSKKNRNGQELVSPIRESARLPARGILETQCRVHRWIISMRCVFLRWCADVSFIVWRYASGAPSKNSMKIAGTDWNQAALFIIIPGSSLRCAFPAIRLPPVIGLFLFTAPQTCKLTCSSGWPVNRRGSRVARWGNTIQLAIYRLILWEWRLWTVD